MDQLRRAALALTLATAAISAPAVLRSDARLRLFATDGGKLRIVSGGRGATIAPVIAVEQAEGGAWRQVGEIGAVDTCGEIGAEIGDVPIRFTPDQVLSVVRWRGWTCEAQCPRLCGVNIYLGPGSFRFVARLVPSGAQAASNTFVMPDRDAAR